jgi:ketosteroid isomerase-like protein
MNRIYKVSLIIISLVITMGCTNQKKTDQIDNSNSERDLMALNDQLDEIEKLCLDLKVENYMSYFHDDAIIFPPGQSIIQGKDSITKFYRVFEELFVPSFKNVYSERSFEINDSIAVRRYNGFAEILFKDSPDTLFSNNKYVDLLKKQPDGSWKIMWHIWNENKPSESSN